MPLYIEYSVVTPHWPSALYDVKLKIYLNLIVVKLKLHYNCIVKAHVPQVAGHCCHQPEAVG